MMINKLIEKKKKKPKIHPYVVVQLASGAQYQQPSAEEPRFSIWAVSTCRHTFGRKSQHSHRVLNGVVVFKTATDINKRFAVQKTLRK